MKITTTFPEALILVLDEKGAETWKDALCKFRKAIASQDTRATLRALRHLLRPFHSERKFNPPIADKQYLIPELLKLLRHEFAKPNTKYVCVKIIKKLLKERRKEDLELEVDWRYLLEITEMMLHRKNRHLKGNSTPKWFPESWGIIISDLSAYFRPGADSEVMEHVLEMLCPQSVTSVKAAVILALFTPVSGQGKPDWLDRIMNLLPIMDGFSWLYPILLLLYRLAFARCGTIDWTPYLGILFTILRQFCGIGVTMQQICPKSPFKKYTSLLPCTPDRIAVLDTVISLMVNLLDTDNAPVVIDMVKKLMDTVTPGYHPSHSSGSNRNCLSVFLSCWFVALEKRVREELRGRLIHAPSIAHLTTVEGKKVVSNLCSLFNEAISIAIFSKNAEVVGAASVSARISTNLSPEANLLDAMLPKIRVIIEMGHLSPCAVSVLEVVTTTLRAMLMRQLESVKSGEPWEGEWISDVFEWGIGLLEFSDKRKLNLALRFALQVCSTIPLIRKGSTDEYYPDAGLSPSFERPPVFSEVVEGFAHAVLDKCTGLLRHYMPAVKGRAELMSLIWYRLTAELLFCNVSPATHQYFLGKLVEIYSSDVITNAVKPFSQLVRAACIADSKRSLEAFMPIVKFRLLKGSVSIPMTVDETSNFQQFNSYHCADLTDTEAQWYISGLCALCSAAGPDLCPYMGTIFCIIASFSQSGKPKLLKLGAKVLRKALYTLTAVLPAEQRMVDNSTWQSERFRSTPWVETGRLYKCSDVQMQWKTPTLQSAKMACDLASSAYRYVEASLAKYTTEGTSALEPPDEGNHDEDRTPGGRVRASLHLLKKLLQGISLAIPRLRDDLEGSEDLQSFVLEAGVQVCKCIPSGETMECDLDDDTDEEDESESSPTEKMKYPQMDNRSGVYKRVFWDTLSKDPPLPTFRRKDVVRLILDVKYKFMDVQSSGPTAGCVTKWCKVMTIAVWVNDAMKSRTRAVQAKTYANFLFQLLPTSHTCYPRAFICIMSACGMRNSIPLYGGYKVDSEEEEGSEEKKKGVLK